MKKEGYITFKLEDFYKIDTDTLTLKVEDERGLIIYESPEDSLRHFSIDDEKITAKVLATPNYTFNSEYYGYNNMFCTDEIKILGIITKDDFYKRASSSTLTTAERVLRGIRFDDEELKVLEKRDHKVSMWIEYYQKGNDKAFEKNKMLVKKNSD